MNTSTQSANFRRDPIPLWINLLSGVVLAILTFQVYAALLRPDLAFGSFDASSPANYQALVMLAGRNVVMIAVTLAALRTQNAMFLAFTFLMHFVREAWDMGMVPFFAEGSAVAVAGQTASFLIFLVPYVFALKKLRKLAAA